ncbi:unnamed protein product, partial [Mycena citricolor]
VTEVEANQLVQRLRGCSSDPYLAADPHVKDRTVLDLQGTLGAQATLHISHCSAKYERFNCTCNAE